MSFFSYAPTIPRARKTLPYERNKLLGGIYSGQFSPTERNVSVSTLRVSTINWRVSNYVCCVERSTLTNTLEFCQIRENNYANSFPAERDQIFNLDDFRFYVRANSHGSNNLLAGSFQKPFSSLVYTNQRFWKMYGNAARARVIICRAKKRSVTVSVALSRITATFHG